MGAWQRRTMQTIKVEGKGKITLQTTLTKKQIAKFNGLSTKLMIVDNTAYLRLDELHGVLMTSSRNQAVEILNKHSQIIQHYLVRDPIKFAPFGVQSGIKPAGIYLLLDHLATVNAKRAPEYRASLCVLLCIISQHPGVLLADRARAHEQESAVNSVIQKVKQKATHCEVSGYPFAGAKGVEKHAHHLEGQSETPELAAEAANLVVIQGWIHDDYHSWALKQNLPIDPVTLGFYALRKGYNGPFVHRIKNKQAS